MNDEIESLPVSASESGKNAYYLPNCTVVEHVPAYCSCLDKIKRVAARDKGMARFSECAHAIRHKTCKALALRSEEVLMGKALYFVPRTVFAVSVSDGTGPDWHAVAAESKQRRRNERAAAKPALDLGIGGSYADAINAAFQAVPSVALPAIPAALQPRPVATLPVKPTVLAPMTIAGESPMQYARRIAASRQPQGAL